MTYRTNDTRLCVSLPADHDGTDIPALVRWAAMNVEKAKGKENILLTDFHLVHAYTTGEQSSICAAYIVLDHETLATRQEALKLAQEAVVSDVLPELEYAAPLQNYSGINRLVQRLAAGPDQDDGLTLLLRVADTIEKLGDVTVLDLIYHDFLDDDALGRPYVSVYFQTSN